MDSKRKNSFRLDKDNKTMKVIVFVMKEDEEIQKIAFEKYGFRTGITGGVYDVSSLGLALPKSITSTVTSLKMDTYNKLIETFHEFFKLIKHNYKLNSYLNLIII